MREGGVDYTDPTDLSARELSSEFTKRQLSPVDVIDAFLSKIEREDVKLHAFTEVFQQEARVRAEQADRAIRSNSALSPWHGVPIAIKDLIEIEGKVALGGSASRRKIISTRTATIVRRLEDLGIIVLGKTHTVEFAMGGWGINQHLGTPWNPWDPGVARAPGGSSSGSAVAAASGLAPWAVGTDTGGSVRLPASYCGLTAIKPCLGRISTFGVLPLSPSLDTPGPIARSLEDAIHLLIILSGFDPRDEKTLNISLNLNANSSGLGGKKLSSLPESERSNVSDDQLAAYDRSLNELANLGAEISEIKLPFSFADLALLNGLVMSTEAYSIYGHLAEDESAPLDEVVRGRILGGRTVLAKDYLSALAKRKELKDQFTVALADSAAFLTPTTPSVAPTIASIDPTKTPAHFTRLANFLDIPAIALPNGVNPDGLPTSLQIMGHPLEENTIIDVASYFQNATKYHLAGPPVKSGDVVGR